MASRHCLSGPPFIIQFDEKSPAARLKSAHSAQSSMVGARKNTRRPAILVIPDSDNGTSAKRNILVYTNPALELLHVFRGLT